MRTHGMVYVEFCFVYNKRQSLILEGTITVAILHFFSTYLNKGIARVRFFLDLYALWYTTSNYKLQALPLLIHRGKGNDDLSSRKARDVFSSALNIK